MSRPVNKENLMSLADTIVWAATNYGGMVSTETQTGEILVPTTAPRGDGHIVKVLYTGFTPDRVVVWIYDSTNSRWYGEEKLG